MADGAVRTRPRVGTRVAERKVTLRQVAAKAGVSPAAVSRAFNPGAPISDALRARVTDAATELGYRPNPMAAGLAGGRSGLVALVVDGLADPATADLLDEMTRALAQEGLTGLLVNVAGEARADRAVQTIRDYGAEAMILVSPTLTRPIVRGLEAAARPTVQAFELRSGDPLVPQAGLRDFAVGRLAATTLARRGYARLAAIAGPAALRGFREPDHSFRNTAERLGLEHVVVQAAGWRAEDGAAAMAALRADFAPDAVFCVTDTLAFGALGALRQAGVPVPSAVGVIGYDDLPSSGHPAIDLATIAFPRADVARFCVDEIVALRNDPSRPPRAAIAEPRLVERGTLRPVQG